MTTSNYHALIVDDEPVSCKMMTFALTQEGFSCDAAKDGEEGILFCRHRDYDLVVTDLVMPNRNGHSLAVDLLAAQSHPVVIVHTSVNEPRLTRDLLLRGVDEVVYKPTNYKALAERAVLLVNQRKSRAAMNSPQGSESGDIDSVELTEVEARLAELAKKSPLPQVVLDVYEMADSDENKVPEIAAAISNNASLKAHVLRLANSAFCRNNPSGDKIDELEKSLLCLGQKRIGELVLADSIFTALTSKPVRWLDVDLAWRRSIAAAVAFDSIFVKGVFPGIGGGLFFSALIHLVGRIALSALYPKQYERMIQCCKETKESLDKLEERVFPLNHGQAISCLLKAWNVPKAISRPMSYTSNSFLSLATVDEPVRTKAELLKLSIFIGQIALGEWESWDKIEFPSAAVFKRLQIESLSGIIESTRQETKRIAGMRQMSDNAPGKKEISEKREPSAPQIFKLLNYCNLSSETFDFLREIVSSMGITLIDHNPNVLESNLNTLANCLWSPPQRFNSTFSSGEMFGAKLIVTDPNHLEYYMQAGEIISLPTSFEMLYAACSDAARHADSVPERPAAVAAEEG